MGLAERKAMSDAAVSGLGSAPIPSIAGSFAGNPTEATVAATEPLKKFRLLSACFFSRGFKVKLL
jgi:hypothetical protein